MTMLTKEWTQQHFDKKHAPKRFSIKRLNDKPALPHLVQYGVYFPKTDLCVFSMGHRGTGRPEDADVIWLDPINPLPVSKRVTFLNAGELTWRHLHSLDDDKQTSVTAGESFVGWVITWDANLVEIIRDGFSILISDLQVLLEDE